MANKRCARQAHQRPMRLTSACSGRGPLILLAFLTVSCSSGPRVHLQQTDVPLLLITQDAGYECLDRNCPYPSQVLAIIWNDGRMIRTKGARESGTFFRRGQLSPAQLGEIHQWLAKYDLVDKSSSFILAEHQPTRSVTLWHKGKRYEFLECFLDHPDPVLEDLISRIARINLLERSISPDFSIPDAWFAGTAAN